MQSASLSARPFPSRPATSGTTSTSTWMPAATNSNASRRKGSEPHQRRSTPPGTRTAQPFICLPSATASLDGGRREPPCLLTLLMPLMLSTSRSWTVTSTPALVSEGAERRGTAGGVSSKGVGLRKKVLFLFRGFLFLGGKRASFLDFPTLVHLVSVLTCKLSLSHPANPTWNSGMVRISFKKPHRRQKKKKKKEIVQKKKRSKLLNPKLTVHPKNQTGIGLLNIALKQPLPTELSALFMCNILQRRQHVHFAGQASAYDHLQPPFSHSFGFYREKKKKSTVFSS